MGGCKAGRGGENGMLGRMGEIGRKRGIHIPRSRNSNDFCSPSLLGIEYLIKRIPRNCEHV